MTHWGDMLDMNMGYMGFGRPQFYKIRLDIG